MVEEKVETGVKPTLKSLKDWDAKVGDIFVYRAGSAHEPSGVPRTITECDGETYHAKDLWRGLSTDRLANAPRWALVERAKETVGKESDGDTKVGSYYNFPFKDWFTVNDMLDYMSRKQWGWRSYIFKDIVKACFRFGQKEGTTEVYDAEKIIYYGTRLLMSVSDKATARKYLQQLLDDKQF